MTRVAEKAVDDGLVVLGRSLEGGLIRPGDASYEEARTLFNSMIDKRPAAVAQCATTEDVVTALRFGQQYGLEIAVRAGGHSVAGMSLCEGGLVIDVRPMKHIEVDPARRTARVGAGCTWGEVDRATQEHGLATTGGRVSSTGVAGLTLGGGIGCLARGLGLSCDNLISADVVTADGRLLMSNENVNADLFWALRGGGGNFGVVTSFEFKLAPIKDIYGGPMFFELEDAGDVIRFYRDFIVDAPETFGGFPAFQIAPPLPFIPEDRHGETFLAFVACWAGPLDEGGTVLKPIHDVAPVVAEHVGPMPYPALNAAFDALAPPGLQHYWKANFVKELTDDAIEAHLAHGPKVPVVNSTVHIYSINGASHRVAPDATAFAYRDATFATVIAGMWPDPAENEANIKWVRDYYDATAPLSEEGGYINFMAEDDQSRIKANYKGNYDRLVDVKRKYDPDNLFHLNQNIKP